VDFKMNFTSRRETDGISYLNPHAPSTQALLKTRIICRLGGAVTDVISVVLTAHENCRPLRLWRLNSWRMSLGAISESAKCVSRVVFVLTQYLPHPPPPWFPQDPLLCSVHVLTSSEPQGAEGAAKET
jgi:hypothetical protein